MQERSEAFGGEAGVVGVMLTRMSFVPGALIVGDSRALAPITFPLRNHELCIISHLSGLTVLLPLFGAFLPCIMSDIPARPPAPAPPLPAGWTEHKAPSGSSSFCCVMGEC